MKKLCYFLIIAVIVLAASSCATTYDKTPFMKGHAGFSAEGSSLWARPSEVGYEITGDIEGTVEYTTLFGFIPLSDTPASANVTGIFGSRVNDIASLCAAYDAMQTVGADGIYILSVYSTRSSNLFTSTETVTIKGKALTLINLGTVTEERADTVRFLNAAGGLNQRNLVPNTSEGSAFETMSSMYSNGF